MPTKRICQTTPRIRGSFQGGDRPGREAAVAVSVAIIRSLAASGRYTFSSADRYCIHQATACPQIVEAALEFELGILAEVAVEDLAVIADQLDLVIGPFLVEPERLTHARGDAEHALDVGIVALRHVVDVFRRNLLFFRLDQRVDDPADDVVQ